MISRALSWALRELGKSHPDRVTSFLREHAATLPAHVAREVRAKIETWRKSGRDGGGPLPDRSRDRG